MNGVITSKRAEDLSPGDVIVRRGRTVTVSRVVRTVNGYTCLELVRSGSAGQRRTWQATVSASGTFEISELGAA